MLNKYVNVIESLQKCLMLMTKISKIQKFFIMYSSHLKCVPMEKILK